MAQIIKSREQFQNAMFTKKYGHNYRGNAEIQEESNRNKTILANNSSHPNAERLRAVITANDLELAERKQDIAAYGKQYDQLAHSHKAGMALGAVSIAEIEQAKAVGTFEKWKAALDPATKSLIDAGSIDAAALYTEMTGSKAEGNVGINAATVDSINGAFGL